MQAKLQLTRSLCLAICQDTSNCKCNLPGCIAILGFRCISIDACYLCSVSEVGARRQVPLEETISRLETCNVAHRNAAAMALLLETGNQTHPLDSMSHWHLSTVLTQTPYRQTMSACHRPKAPTPRRDECCDCRHQPRRVLAEHMILASYPRALDSCRSDLRRMWESSKHLMLAAKLASAVPLRTLARYQPEIIAGSSHRKLWPGCLTVMERAPGSAHATAHRWSRVLAAGEQARHEVLPPWHVS